jgi:hypothetical protein
MKTKLRPFKRGHFSHSNTDIDISILALLLKSMSVLPAQRIQDDIASLPAGLHAFWCLSLMRITDQRTCFLSVFLRGSWLFVFDSPFGFSLHVCNLWWWSQLYLTELKRTSNSFTSREKQMCFDSSLISWINQSHKSLQWRWLQWKVCDAAFLVYNYQPSGMLSISFTRFFQVRCREYEGSSCLETVPWRWRQQATPERWWQYTRRHITREETIHHYCCAKLIYHSRTWSKPVFLLLLNNKVLDFAVSLFVCYGTTNLHTGYE